MYFHFSTPIGSHPLRANLFERARLSRTRASFFARRVPPRVRLCADYTRAAVPSVVPSRGGRSSRSPVDRSLLRFFRSDCERATGTPRLRLSAPTVLSGGSADLAICPKSSGKPAGGGDGLLDFQVTPEKRNSGRGRVASGIPAIASKGCLLWGMLLERRRQWQKRAE